MLFCWLYVGCDGHVAPIPHGVQCVQANIRAGHYVGKPDSSIYIYACLLHAHIKYLYSPPFASSLPIITTHNHQSNARSWHLISHCNIYLNRYVVRCVHSLCFFVDQHSTPCARTPPAHTQVGACRVSSLAQQYAYDLVISCFAAFCFGLVAYGIPQLLPATVRIWLAGPVLIWVLMSLLPVLRACCTCLPA